jgi:hypothetical protein
MDFRLEISLQDSNSDLMTSPRYRFFQPEIHADGTVEVEYIAENQIVQEIIRSSLDSIKPPRFQFGLDDQSEVSI